MLEKFHNPQHKQDSQGAWKLEGGNLTTDLMILFNFVHFHGGINMVVSNLDVDLFFLIQGSFLNEHSTRISHGICIS